MPPSSSAPNPLSLPRPPLSNSSIFYRTFSFKLPQLNKKSHFSVLNKVVYPQMASAFSTLPTIIRHHQDSVSSLLLWNKVLSSRRFLTYSCFLGSGYFLVRAGERHLRMPLQSLCIWMTVHQRRQRFPELYFM